MQRTRRRKPAEGAGLSRAFDGGLTSPPSRSSGEGRLCPAQARPSLARARSLPLAAPGRPPRGCGSGSGRTSRGRARPGAPPAGGGGGRTHTHTHDRPPVSLSHPSSAPPGRPASPAPAFLAGPPPSPGLLLRLPARPPRPPTLSRPRRRPPPVRLRKDGRDAATRGGSPLLSPRYLTGRGRPSAAAAALARTRRRFPAQGLGASPLPPGYAGPARR